MEQTNGMIVLQQPPGQHFSHVWLASGKVARPDEKGRICVGAGDASALIGANWQPIRPPPPRAA